MKVEKANLKFKQQDFLIEVIAQYNRANENCSRRCDLKLVGHEVYEITVVDGIELIPYGLFDVGTYIGQRLVYDNYRIEMIGGKKLIKQRVYEKDIIPTEIEFLVILNEDETFKLNFTFSTLFRSSIDKILPFITEKDFEEIAKFSEFRRTENNNSKKHLSHNNLWIHYLIKGNYLFIFGIDVRFNKPYVRIELDSVIEINKPIYDF